MFYTNKPFKCDQMVAVTEGKAFFVILIEQNIQVAYLRNQQKFYIMYKVTQSLF